MEEVLLGFRILFLAQTSEAKKAEPRKFNVNNMEEEEEEEKILRSFCQTTHTHTQTLCCKYSGEQQSSRLI
jgi:hypothetical protein